MITSNNRVNYDRDNQNRNSMNIDELISEAIGLKHDLQRLNIKMDSGKFDIDKDYNSWIKKDKELSLLIMKIERIDPDVKKSFFTETYTKPTNRQTKRCC